MATIIPKEQLLNGHLFQGGAYVLFDLNLFGFSRRISFRF